MKIKSKYSESLVQRVNELYHDDINESYDESHPEILRQETERWRNCISEIKFPSEISYLDFGTGTGFVPLTILDLLPANTHVTCADISQNMLNEAAKNISEKHSQSSVRYHKMEPKIPFELPFPDNSFDLITMNSVLHHIKDTRFFTSELNRICKKDGRIIFAHEPNNRFNKNGFLESNYDFLHFLIDPIYASAGFMRKTGLLALLQNLVYLIFPARKNKIQSKIDFTRNMNEKLMSEKLIEKPLTKEEITMITDISAFEGFDPFHLSKFLIPEKIVTYNHLFRISIKKASSKHWMNYERKLEKQFPKDGATFFGIYQNRKNI
jgi:ubiquinone/menaquinone biosynthesis C-methylase UbiE